MTERRDGASALPMSVTCSPDDRIADAIRALVERVGTEAGSADRALLFKRTVEHVMEWVLAHRAAVDGQVAIHFDRDEERLLGHLQWTSSGTSPVHPGLPPVASSDVRIDCGVEGSEVHCRVTCRCT